MTQKIADWEDILNFGKYRGLRVGDVPASYVLWCAENGAIHIDAEMLEAVELDAHEDSERLRQVFEDPDTGNR